MAFHPPLFTRERRAQKVRNSTLEKRHGLDSREKAWLDMASWHLRNLQRQHYHPLVKHSCSLRTQHRHATSRQPDLETQKSSQSWKPTKSLGTSGTASPAAGGSSLSEPTKLHRSSCSAPESRISTTRL